jgi:6-phosphogluconate dehydrogenase
MAGRVAYAFWMRIGMVGLGRMGANMTRRLLEAGHEVVAFDLDAEAVAGIVSEGATGAASIEEIVTNLESPRHVWLMVPAGGPTEAAIRDVAAALSEGDVIIDGGNSRYTDSMRRAEEVAGKGISFVDAGVSGGIWGLENGFALMVGGSEEVCQRLEPIFTALAPEGGYARVGDTGAGHFVKMVHNGIEYALMQSYGEGFALLQSSDFHLDLAQIASLWTKGTVIRSWLLELAARALDADPKLSAVEGYVQDSGEGRWTVEEAIDAAVPVPTIALSLFARFASRDDDAFSDKLIAALRKEFGGHETRGPGESGE